jgi:hypothetical protein
MRVTDSTSFKAFELSFLSSVAFSLALAGCSSSSSQPGGGGGSLPPVGGISIGGAIAAGGQVVVPMDAGMAGSTALAGAPGGSTAAGGAGGMISPDAGVDLARPDSSAPPTPDAAIPDSAVNLPADGGVDSPVPPPDAPVPPPADASTSPDGGLPDGGGSGGGCPVPQWDKMLSVPTLNGMATDKNGNLFVATTFYTGDFDSVALTSAGSADLLIAKIDPTTGAASWAKLFGDASDQFATQLAVSKSGQVGVIGTFTGNMVVGSSITNAAPDPIDFMAAVDSSGGGLWAKAVDTTGGKLYAMAGSAAQDAFVVCGYTTGSATTLDPQTTTNSDGNEDVLVAKINSATGAILWGRQIGGAGTQLCTAAALDAAGNVFVAGIFNGTFDLGTGALSPAPAATASGKAIWVAKLDGATGATVQAKSWGNDLRQQVNALALDSAGNLALVGMLRGTVSVGSLTLGSGSSTDGGVAATNTDGFAIKLSGTTLDPLWVRGWGDAKNQEADCMAFDSNDDLIVAGAIKGTADFGGGISLTAVTGVDSYASPNFDAYWVKLKGDTGAALCAQNYGDAYTQVANSVAVSRTPGGPDAVILAGYLNGMIDFGLPSGALIAGVPGTSSANVVASFLVELAP